MKKNLFLLKIGSISINIEKDIDTESNNDISLKAKQSNASSEALRGCICMLLGFLTTYIIINIFN